MMEDESFNVTCEQCGGDRFEQQNDGFYYCTDCHYQSQHVMETGVADEAFAKAGGEGFYMSSHRRKAPAVIPGFRAGAPVIKAEPISQYMPDSDVCGIFGGFGVKNEGVMGEEFSCPFDFGLPMDYDAGDEQARYSKTYNEVRLRYVMGVQVMLVMQCKALVERFEVNPLICGYASSIWMRYVAASGVFDDGWADNAISESEDRQPEMPEDKEHPPRYYREFRNSHGQRAILIWYRSLRKIIPLPSSLAISFLACHVAREFVLPTDIVKWTLEGNLPYLAAFSEIEKVFTRNPSICHLSASFMFRPSEVVPIQKLEAMAAQVAETVGLDLPPVNFHAIASRYLKKLSLPVEKIMNHADRIVDWSMPAELWLSVNELRLPTRVYVMAVLIVSIRILYNIHGFGAWEKYLTSHARVVSSQHSSNLKSLLYSADESPSKGDSVLDKGASLDSGELLWNLQATYQKLQDQYEHSKDLPTYLNYCKDIVFAGIELSGDFDKTIAAVAEEFWHIYKDGQVQDEEFRTPYASKPKRKRSRHFGTPHDDDSSDSKRMVYSDDGHLSAHGISSDSYSLSELSDSDDHSVPHTNNDPISPAINHQPSSTEIEEAINRLRADMEENRFCYIPPRVNVKRHDYLYYVRKKDEGAYTYAAHADYYILLQACSKVAQVDIRLMHMAVLNFERRLAWIEKRIDHCLNSTPPDVESDSDDANLSDIQL